MTTGDTCATFEPTAGGTLRLPADVGSHPGRVPDGVKTHKINLRPLLKPTFLIAKHVKHIFTNMPH